jgi:hypothetical protein
MEQPEEEGFYWVIIPAHKPPLKVVEIYDGGDNLEMVCMFADDPLPFEIVGKWCQKIEPPEMESNELSAAL